VKYGFKIFAMSLNLGNGVISLILLKNSSTSVSEKSLEADKFLFLLTFFSGYKYLENFINKSFYLFI
jgi:hypothetical protein